MQEVAASELHDPVHIAVEPDQAGEGTIDHVIHETSIASRFQDLARLLDDHPKESVIIFGRTKHGVDKLERQLRKAGYETEALHGNMTQGQRQRALDRFRDRRCRILVATNVAARGIDVRHVGLVVNYELPESADLLTHRIGRTGRMGSHGKAITLISAEEEHKWLRLRRTGAPDLPRRMQGRVSAPPKPIDRGRIQRPAITNLRGNA